MSAPPLNAPSDQSPPFFDIAPFKSEKRIFLLAPADTLYSTKVSLDAGVVTAVCPFISTPGVVATGVPVASNQTTCPFVPVRTVSVHEAFVVITDFGVIHVRSHPDVFSLFTPRFVTSS